MDNGGSAEDSAYESHPELAMNSFSKNAPPFLFNLSLNFHVRQRMLSSSESIILRSGCVSGELRH